MNLPIQNHIIQVEEGIAYKGNLKIREQIIEFNLRFLIPISLLDKLSPLYDMEELRDIFQLNIKQGGRAISLDDDEYLIFLDFIFTSVFRFYLDNREKNKLLRSISIYVEPGLITTIEKSGFNVYDLTPADSKALSHPKFGIPI